LFSFFVIPIAILIPTVTITKGITIKIRTMRTIIGIMISMAVTLRRGGIIICIRIKMGITD
jgi:hypothetical protein